MRQKVVKISDLVSMGTYDERRLARSSSRCYDSRKFCSPVAPRHFLKGNDRYNDIGFAGNKLDKLMKSQILKQS